jgi:glutathione S-transferase
MSTLYADQEFYPHISRILREFRKPPEQRNQEWIGDELNKFQSNGLSYLESSLQEQQGTFLFGQLTLADIAYAPGLDTLLRASGLTLDAYPAIQQWFKEMTRLPAFEKTLPFALA